MKQKLGPKKYLNLYGTVMIHIFKANCVRSSNGRCLSRYYRAGYYLHIHNCS